MHIASDAQDIEAYIGEINEVHQEHPILVDQYVRGTEVEIDAICDGTDILIPGIMEHIERTGIHSGDSISVYPPRTLTPGAEKRIVEYAGRLAEALHVRGMMNIQFIARGDEVSIIEVNPRSSRTVPYISKVTGIPIIDLASRVICGHTLRELGYRPGLQPDSSYTAIKMPVFSFEKILGAEIALGPEMKSTGECLGISRHFHEALEKAFTGAGMRLPRTRKMIISVKDSAQEEMVPVARTFASEGYEIYATAGTWHTLHDAGIPCTLVRKLEEPSPNILDLVLEHRLDVIIDVPEEGLTASRGGFRMRRTAVETGVHVISSADTARALAEALSRREEEPSLIDISSIGNRPR